MARARFDTAFAEDCRWGVYCRYDEEPSIRGLQRFYQAVTVAKDDARAFKLAEERKHWSYTANHSLHLFAELVPPSMQVHRDEQWIQPNVKNFVTRKVPAEPASQLWLVVILEVSPEAVRASCIDAEGAFFLPSLPQKSNMDFVKILRDRYEDVAAMPWFPRPDCSAVGLFLRASVCTVSGFRVEPMAVANLPPK
jgi:hypothetical protein